MLNNQFELEEKFEELKYKIFDFCAGNNQPYSRLYMKDVHDKYDR